MTAAASPARSCPGDASTVALNTQWGFVPNPGKYETNVVETGYTKIEAWHAIGELEWTFDAGTWTTVVAHRDLDYKATINVDGTPFSLTIFPDNVEKAEQFSIESRFNGNITDNLDYLVGVFYMDAKSDVTELREIRSNTSTAVSYFASYWNQDSTTVGGLRQPRLSLHRSMDAVGGPALHRGREGLPHASSADVVRRELSRSVSISRSRIRRSGTRSRRAPC